MGACSRSAFVERRFERRFPTTVWVVVGDRPTVTNELLVGALHERGVPAELVQPARASSLARPGDIVLGRLDVRPTLDGVEDGIWELRRVERMGIQVLNPAPSLVACHDKLQTVLRLAAAGVSQPATSHVDRRGFSRKVGVPVVVKPRFGSWGRDVFLCESRAELEQRVRKLSGRRWFRRQGALVQAYVPSMGFDLRLVVAGGEVVGAVQRVAPAGEWRTNIALGGSRRPVAPPAEACLLAVAAAAAVGGDLVGVDLLPLVEGGYVVLEVNGAVDFTSEYSPAGRDIFGSIAAYVAGGKRELDVDAAELMV